jgi:hypothetical protein
MQKACSRDHCRLFLLSPAAAASQHNTTRLRFDYNTTRLGACYNSTALLPCTLPALCRWRTAAAASCALLPALLLPSCSAAARPVGCVSSGTNLHTPCRTHHAAQGHVQGSCQPNEAELRTVLAVDPKCLPTAGYGRQRSCLGQQHLLSSADLRVKFKQYVAGRCSKELTPSQTYRCCVADDVLPAAVHACAVLVLAAAVELPANFWRQCCSVTHSLQVQCV